MVRSVLESPGLIWLAAANYADKAAAGWFYKLLASPPVIIYSTLFEGDGRILAAFYILFFIDLAAGLAAALKKRCFQFQRLSLWAVKFMTYSLCIGIAGLVNLALARSLGLPLLDVVLTILIASEALSIFENLRELGCPVPPVFLKLAAGVKSQAGKKLEARLEEEDDRAGG